MNGGRRLGCSRGKSSASRGLCSVSGYALRERSLLETTEMHILSSFFERLCWKRRATTSDSNL